MTRLPAVSITVGLLISLMAMPLQSHAQSNSQRPGGSGSSSNTNNRPPANVPQQGRPMDQSQGPVYVSGRILLETGKPSPEPISVELNCGMRPLQVIHTDLGGYFTFSLGAGLQSNIDFSASNDNPLSQGNGRTEMPGGVSGSLTGCELRVAVPGYHPLTYTLSQHADMGRMEVGSLHLQRLAGVEGSAISVTSLMVPNSARKEYEKAQKEIRNNHDDAARQHLEAAVGQYDKFAAAWNELGRLYSSTHANDKAMAAYQKAIAADPQYTPPYLSLATMELQGRQYENAVETATKLLDLDSSISFASFVQAVGNFNLNRLDDAEKSAREAEKGAHENLSQIHALLAQIFLQKQDYPRAVAQMRTYLKEAPQGQYADQMKKNLEEIQRASNEAGGEPVSPSNEPQR